MDTSEPAIAKMATPKRANPILEAGAWTAGVLLIVVGLPILLMPAGNGPPSGFVGLTFILVGVLVIPPTFKEIRKWVPFRIPGWVHALVVACAFLMSVSVTPSLLGEEAGIAKWKRDHPTPPPSPALAHVQAATPSTPAESVTASSKPPPEVPSAWRYSSTTDEMRGLTTDHAELTSDNTLDFALPYAGGSQGELDLRRTAGAPEVMLQIDKGQFLCSPFMGHVVSVRFDDGAVQRFGCSGSSDGDTKVTFISPAARFVKALKASRRVMIEAEFFQEGRRQLIFTSAGLNW